MKIKNPKIGFLVVTAALISISVFALFYTGVISPSRNVEDTANVNHPTSGSFPKILTDVSYDVDTSQSFSLNYTRYLIENASSLADGNNDGWSDLYEKFHFWPNIFDLTEIYYRDKELYNKIVDEILENAPDKNNTAANISIEILKGERVFLARDFVSVVNSRGKTYYEVHYAFLINLDKKYIREILVHEFEEQGLSTLHDPHTEELASLFNKSDVPLGQAWEICLRGNLKRTKYNSIIVDKLDESPNPEFFIERVHLSCEGCHNKEELPIAPPLIPLKKPPPNPKPEEKIPILSKNPNNPQPPLIRPGPSGSVTTPGPSVRPWPFGYSEKPEDESPQFTPGGGEVEDGRECPEDEEAIYQKQQMLMELNNTLEESIARFNEDIKILNDNFTCYPGQWNDSATFNNPCIQELYADYNEKVQELKRQIDKLQMENGNISNEIMSLRDKFSPEILAYMYREYLWANMLTVNDERWADIGANCFTLLPSPDLSAAGIGAEQFQEFERNVYYGLMNGKTWDEAVNAAIENGGNDNFWKTLARQYASCLKNMQKDKLGIFLRIEFENASDENITRMINIMFNGQASLVDEQINQLENINEQMDELRERQNELANQIFDKQTQINDLRRQFRQEIKENCLNNTREEIERNRQTVWIIESFLEYCKNPEEGYEFKYINRVIFCNTLNKMLNNTAYTGNHALNEYLKMLLENHCG